MVFRRSRPSGYGGSQDEDPRPRLHIPVIATLVGALVVMNIASAVLAMID